MTERVSEGRPEPRTEARDLAVKAAQQIVFDWYARGLIKFRPDDDGGDDLLLGKEVADAVLTQLRPFPGAPQETPGPTDATFDRIEAACPECGGFRWYASADPNDYGEAGAPIQVQCANALHVAVIYERAALSGSPQEQPPDLRDELIRLLRVARTKHDEAPHHERPEGLTPYIADRLIEAGVRVGETPPGPLDVERLQQAIHEAERKDTPGARGPIAVEWPYLTNGERAWERARAESVAAEYERLTPASPSPDTLTRAKSRGFGGLNLDASETIYEQESASPSEPPGLDAKP